MASSRNGQVPVQEEAPSETQEKPLYPVRIPFVPGRPNAAQDRIKFYTCELPARVTASFGVEQVMVDAEGFQRALDLRRAEKIGKLQVADVPHVHGGLLAYARNKDDVVIPPTGPRVLTLNKPLFWLDGQHRGGGDRYAVAMGKDDYTESVRIVVGATGPELIDWYLKANMEQRKTTPGNILLNVARMEGTQQRRKSWIARIVRSLALVEPFYDPEDGTSLVNFGTTRSNPIQAAVLYRVIDVILPDELNREGPDVEIEAGKYALKALTFYAECHGDKWAAKSPSGAYLANDAYSHTMMVAFAKLWVAAQADEALVARAFELSHLARGIPANVGSGDRAATAIATTAAGAAGIDLAHAALAIA